MAPLCRRDDSSKHLAGILGKGLGRPARPPTAKAIHSARARAGRLLTPRDSCATPEIGATPRAPTVRGQAGAGCTCAGLGRVRDVPDGDPRAVWLGGEGRGA